MKIYSYSTLVQDTTLKVIKGGKEGILLQDVKCFFLISLCTPFHLSFLWSALYPSMMRFLSPFLLFTPSILAICFSLFINPPPFSFAPRLLISLCFLLLVSPPGFSSRSHFLVSLSGLRSICFCSSPFIPHSPSSSFWLRNFTPFSLSLRLPSSSGPSVALCLSPEGPEACLPLSTPGDFLPSVLIL